MKIYINNLGPINHFEFDLSKDLNLIYGENSVGKSYAMTVVYIIVKHFVHIDFPAELFSLGRTRDVLTLPQFQQYQSLVSGVSRLEKKVKDSFVNKNLRDVEITLEYAGILQGIVEMTLLINIEKSFKNSFESIKGLSNKLTKENFIVKVEYTDFDFIITAKENKLVLKHFSLRRKTYFRIVETNAKEDGERDEVKVVFAFRNENGSLMDDVFSQVVISISAILNETSQVVPNVYFLPASRSGLYRGLSSLSPLIAELSKSRTSLGGKMELPNISEAVSDYFLHLSNIKSENKNEKYTSLVSEIEEKILDGKIIFNDDTKKIMFSPNDVDLELDLAFTSSMISEIALIVAFLKYKISNKSGNGYVRVVELNKIRKISNLIFIEEPEAHLHPKVQILLMELFTKVANQDTKIIFTTHSNYMFHKLSNLILDKKIKPERVGSYLMRYDKKKGAVLDSLAMEATEEGMMDENFADVSEQLYEERIKIYDKLNEDAD